MFPQTPTARARSCDLARYPAGQFGFESDDLTGQFGGDADERGHVRTNCFLDRLRHAQLISTQDDADFVCRISDSFGTPRLNSNDRHSSCLRLRFHVLAGR